MKKLRMSGFNLRPHLRDARLKVVIVAVLAIFTLVPFFSAMAQEEEAQEEDSFMLEEITVTGSRIRGVEGVGTSVIGIDRDDMSMAASLTVDKIIKELPSIMDLGVTEVTRAQSGGEMNRTAASSINIHGIGPYSTLTLFNGRRMTNNGQGVEAGTLPSMGVERIEVAADGASAIYGSDAVAGVVNIIPRRTLDGVEASFKIGQAQDMDPEWKAGGAVGKMWDSGQFMIAYEHSFRGSLSSEDRPYYTADQRAWGGSDWRTNLSSPGTIIVSTGGGGRGAPPPSVTTYAIPGGGVTQETADLLVPGTENLFETFYGKDMLPEQETNNYMVTFSQKINDLEFFLDGYHAQRDAINSRSGYASGEYTVPNTNLYWVQPPGTTVDSYVIAINWADIPGAPKGVSFADVKNWQIAPGFRYDLPHGFQLEAAYTYGETTSISGSDGQVSTRAGRAGQPPNALDIGLASGDPETAIDLWGGGRTTPEALAALSSGYSFGGNENVFKGYEVSVNGPVFDLPGGTVRVAAGYDGQRYDLRNKSASGDHPDPVVYEFDPPNKREVDSVYFEVYVPLFGKKNARTGLSRLELTAAVRHDEYSVVGGTTNPKFGFNYSPIESLTFHGSYGTSFRAPQIEDVGESIWSNYSIMQQSYMDPTSPSGTTRGYFLRGANPDIKPETSKNHSLGVAYTPTKDTKFQFDFYSVKYEDQIQSYMSNTTSLLTYEADFAGSGVILRGEDADNKILEWIDLGVDFDSYVPGSATLFVDGRKLNLGSSLTQGIDFQISHNLRTDTAGLFRFSLSGSYMLKYDVAFVSGGPERDQLNLLNNPLRFKARGGVTWRYEPFTTQVSMRYVNEYDNPSVTPTQRVDSWMPVDLVLRFDGDDVDWLGSFGTGFSVTLEGRNIFDEDPPYVNFAPNFSGGGGWDPSAADPVGRLFSVSVSKKF